MPGPAGPGTDAWAIRVRAAEKTSMSKFSASPASSTAKSPRPRGIGLGNARARAMPRLAPLPPAGFKRPARPGTDEVALAAGPGLKVALMVGLDVKLADAEAVGLIVGVELALTAIDGVAVAETVALLLSLGLGVGVGVKERVWVPDA